MKKILSLVLSMFILIPTSVLADVIEPTPTQMVLYTIDEYIPAILIVVAVVIVAIISIVLIKKKKASK